MGSSYPGDKTIGMFKGSFYIECTCIGRPPKYGAPSLSDLGFYTELKGESEGHELSTDFHLSLLPD